MRNNPSKESVCSECGQNRKQVLDMFDLHIAGQTFTICDACNEALFSKTLKAECYKNGRVKSKEDMLIINRRRKLK